MNLERWETVAAVLDEVLRLDPEARPGFLNERCGSDASLRHSVEQLMAADARASSFLKAAAPKDLLRRTVVADLEPGDRIGPYEITRLLGRGGMGAVFEATRVGQDFKQRVAIKIILDAEASETVVRRFLGERQILASLEHECIARLYEGGTTESGRPYLVMEYIDGLPIDDYCDRHGLGVRERIRLFRQVLGAVQFAHQSLIVHRDLKPANILVNRDGGPKLLDFGIAKLLDPSLFPLTVEVTAGGVGPMTLAYCSPEQLRGRPITTRSDVFSLGVVLHKLLTGQLPQTREREPLAAALADELVAPSEILVDTKPARGNVLPTALEQRRRQLAGDLDAIVGKALRREEEHRYGSVNELDEDLDRYLRDLPVSARRSTMKYRAGRMLRRNRALASMVFVVLALGAAFGVNSHLQARRLARERDQVAVERDKALEVSRFVVDLFEAMDPRVDGDPEMPVRTLLERAAARVDDELVDQPVIQAALYETLGTAYGNLGLFDKAVPMFERAIDLRHQHLDARHPDIGESLRLLADAQYSKGDFESAETTYERALRFAETTYGTTDPKVADVLAHYGAMLLFAERPREAESSLKRALTIYEEAGDRPSEDLPFVLSSLAGAYRVGGRRDLAAAHYERALAISETLLAPDDPTRAIILNDAAILYSDLGDAAKARRYGERSLAILERRLPPGHPMLATVAFNLSRYCRDDPAAAEAFLQRANAIWESSIGTGHPMATYGSRGSGEQTSGSSSDGS